MGKAAVQIFSLQNNIKLKYQLLKYREVFLALRNGKVNIDLDFLWLDFHTVLAHPGQ